ncbi:hypothetical protein [Streptomyces sp. MK37H]|uniref:hypothetical protein n=1 Tax=Streptomyces sp. MK37H TaxID=2699117 RepID=UPI001B37A375|nr:hypothetical protein [Streptomyces sp. MK37H]MBP8535683.1 hypothetical protein [Streptomyces sp. MK37H]
MTDTVAFRPITQFKALTGKGRLSALSDEVSDFRTGDTPLRREERTAGGGAAW